VEIAYLACNIAPVCAETDAATTIPLAASCKAVENIDFARILDPPTQLTEAKLVEASGGKPALCLAKGYISPQVGIELRLPIANWSGRFIEVGCGGHCGMFFTGLCNGLLR
jgi:hypothetical protein